MKEAHKEQMKQRGRIAKKLQTHHPGETMDGHDMELFNCPRKRKSYMKVNEVKDDVVSDTDSDSDYMLRVIRNKVQIVQGNYKSCTSYNNVEKSSK